MFEWGIEKHGGTVHIFQDTVWEFLLEGELPTETILTIDIETDEKDRIVCIGVTGNGTDVYVYFNPTEQLFEWLRTKQLIGHDLSHAEIPWLKKHGFSMANAYWDTKIGFYVWDSTRKNYGLKDIVKDTFQVEYPSYKEMVGKGKKKVTLDKQDKEIVAAYNSCDVFWTHKLYQWLQKNYNLNQRNFFNNIEWPTTKLIFEMEQLGVKIDTKEVRRIHNETSKKRRQARKELFRLARKQFNPNSPKQVLPLLQESGARVSKTDEDTIKRLAGIPFVGALLSYRGLQKLTSTYTIPLYTNAIQAIDRRIHARFSQNTITGRLSSSDPINLQNQPQAVRSCFVPRAGHSFIEADYSNLEWRIPGHFSGDPAIISELSRRDGDIHMQTARLMFGQSVSDSQRKIAKTCNFLLTNSGRAKRLATELGCSYREADEIYNKFWAGYRVLGEWTRATKLEAKRQGGVSTMFGRHVKLPGLLSWCGRANCPVVDKNFFCKECFKREETEREAVSVRVQGSGADLIKLAMLRLRRDYGYVPVLSVHDSLMYEVEDSKIQEVSKNVVYVMENICDLKVPLFVDIGVGKSWAECK